MKFKIGDTVYTAVDLDDLTLKMAIQLEEATSSLGRALTLGELSVMGEELQALKTDKERATHPATPWVLAVSIWASRNLAGENLTFADAIDFPMSQLTFLKEPQDHKKPVNPTKARQAPRKGSGRAVSRPRVAASTET